VSISIRWNPIRRSKQGFWRDQAGFTLVELILALLIFSILSASIFAAFAAISKGVERGRGNADFYHVGRAAMRQIDQELQAAFQFSVPVSVPERGGTIPSYVREPFKGEDATADSLPRDRVIFLTIPLQRFPENAARNELCQVCYYVANNAQGVPALFRYEDCTLANDAADDEDRCSGKQEPLELTDAIVGLDVTYYGQEGEEYAEWPPQDPEDPLPCQARVTLFLQAGEQPVRSLTTTVVPQMRGTCEAES
jgi:prepilin-type N-terminal cleavage/methylation domain-containing protein